MQYKTFKIFSILSLSVVALLAATRIPQTGERNLKVLPKDISDEKLDSIMHSYNKALGVSCNFCHVAYEGFTDSLNFASDKDPMKENARDMMRMVRDINSKYFYFDKTQNPEYLNTVTCITCHRGEVFPDESAH